MNTRPLKESFTLALLDGWQRDFPLEERPFVHLAQQTGVSEGRVLDALRQLRADGILTRIGAVVRPNTVAVSTLAAMKVPSGDLRRVADIVNGEPGVNHNYEREHAFNLWFVATARDSAALAATLNRIERKSGIGVLGLPLAKAHHIDLGFSLGPGPCRGLAAKVAALSASPCKVTERDRELLAAIEDGLPLVSRPYRTIARRLRVEQGEVISRLSRLIAGGVISRFGLVVRHRRLGYTHNAMAVWDIDASDVDALGDRLAKRSFVTLCYQRRRARPHWPYNLFCMIHGEKRALVEQQVRELDVLASERSRGHAVLFSKRCFKQRGARFSLSAEKSKGQTGVAGELSHAR